MLHCVLMHTTTCREDDASELLHTTSMIKHQPEEEKMMMLNVTEPSPVTTNGDDLPATEDFIYIGSTVRYNGGASDDTKNLLCEKNF